MSIRVQCGVCSRQFVAPDEVRGRRFKCPACSSPIDVPYDDDQPAIDLRWSESPASAAPSAIPAISPEMTQREVFGRPTSAPPLPSSPSLTQPNRKADLPTFIFSHRLVLAVFAFCVAF